MEGSVLFLAVQFPSNLLFYVKYFWRIREPWLFSGQSTKAFYPPPPTDYWLIERLQKKKKKCSLKQELFCAASLTNYSYYISFGGKFIFCHFLTLMYFQFLIWYIIIFLLNFDNIVILRQKKTKQKKHVNAKCIRHIIV